MIGKHLIPRKALIDPTHPLGVGCLASFDLLEGPIHGLHSIRCRARRLLFRAGASLTSASWGTVGSKAVMVGDGTGSEYFSASRGAPIRDFPFTIVVRVKPKATTSDAFYTLLNLVDLGGGFTRAIFIDASTNLRAIVRNGGTTANAADYLALSGPAVSANNWYTIVFAAWGPRSTLCKLWTKRDDEGTINTYSAGSDFAMTFPTGMDLERVGAFTTTMNADLEIVRVFRFAARDAWANDVCANPHKLYGALVPQLRVPTVLPPGVILPGGGVYPRMVS